MFKGSIAQRSAAIFFSLSVPSGRNILVSFVELGYSIALGKFREDERDDDDDDDDIKDDIKDEKTDGTHWNEDEDSELEK